MPLAKLVRFAKFEPFLKTSIFWNLGATLSKIMDEYMNELLNQRKETVL